ncbi:Transcriptional regulator, TetR family [hydrothermal vent metagenome]|uniref:Transcriptional regulator, TetR family n=1 Tax=hydrothermal vent metagenome TaxID=652676 RepID=A0A3B1E9E2_9ZZZZ
MPKIVDKQQKRKDIALSSTELFCQKGFYKLTVSEVALNANIAKGTIYKYFKNKEDIVFAIIEYAQDSYDQEVLLNIQNTSLAEEKILALFNLCIGQGKQDIQRRKIYKEFISICLNEPSVQIINLQKDIKKKYTSWLRDILQDGIDKKLLKPEVLEFVDGLYAMGESVLIFSHLKNYNDVNMLQKHIKSLLKLNRSIKG